VTVFHVFVPGIPRPAGSKSAFPFKRKNGKLGVAVSDGTGEAGKAWRAQIAGVVVPAWGGRPLLDLPLKLTLKFAMPRPKSHRRASGQLKDSAPRHHIGKPDVLKLARAVEDALTGVVYVDDRLIVAGHYWKGYKDSPGVTITIEEATT